MVSKIALYVVLSYDHCNSNEFMEFNYRFFIILFHNPTNEQSRSKWFDFKQDKTDCGVSGDKTLTGAATPDIKQFYI